LDHKFTKKSNAILKSLENLLRNEFQQKCHMAENIYFR